MAYSITFQPDLILHMARSPLIAVVRETDPVLRDDPTFLYYCRIQNYAGPLLPLPAVDSDIIAELTQPPRPNGLGMFNVQPYLEASIQKTGAFSTLSQASSLVENLRLHFGYYLDGVAYPQAMSDTAFRFTDGYAIQQQGINLYEHSTDIIDCKRFMTTAQNIEVVSDRQAWVHLFAGQAPDRQVEYRRLNGLNPFTISMPSNISIWRLPIGVEDVNAISTNPAFSADDGFSIRVVDSISTEEYQQLFVRVLPKGFCGIESESLAYINRFGVWDYLHGRGRSVETIKQSRTEWTRRIGVSNQVDAWTYINGTSQMGVIGVLGEKEIAFSTGYVNGETREKIQDLMLSLNVLSARLDVPVILMNNQIVLQDGNGADLINYDLQFKIAGNIIQDII